MATVNVRYMVEDVQAAVDFYTTHLGFRLLSSIELFQPVRRREFSTLTSSAERHADGASCRSHCATVSDLAHGSTEEC